MYWLTYIWFKRSKRSGELKGSADHDRVKDAFVSFDKPAFSDQDKPWTDLSNEQVCILFITIYLSDICKQRL